MVGRDKYGVFPLRGKLLNVRDQTAKRVMENEELTHLRMILGLTPGKLYKTEEERSELRYGKVMLMTDQDHDGKFNLLCYSYIHTNFYFQDHILRVCLSISCTDFGHLYSNKMDSLNNSSLLLLKHSATMTLKPSIPHQNMVSHVKIYLLKSLP